MSVAEFCKENLVEREGTNCLKWDDLGNVFGDCSLLPFWLADMEFKTPEGVREAVRTLNDRGVYGYGIVPDSYYESVKSWQKNRHNMDIEKHQIRFETGVVGALYKTVQAFTEKDDHIMIFSPVYYPFYDIILNSGRQLVTSELLNNAGSYTYNFEDIEKQIKEKKVKAIINCSPHNPVGRVWTEEELDQLFSICEKYDVLILSDEIHQDFTYEKKFISASEIHEKKYQSRIITFHAASKTFNLAGLIHSHTFIFNEALMEKYDAYIKTLGKPETNLMGITCVEAAYRTGEKWLEDLKEVILHNYHYMVNTFSKKAPKILVSPLEGTYLAWVDLRGYMDGTEVEKFTMKTCKLAVDVGEWFSFTGHGFIRINLATNPELVKEAVKRIVENLPKS